MFILSLRFNVMICLKSIEGRYRMIAAPCPSRVAFHDCCIRFCAYFTHSFAYLSIARTHASMFSYGVGG